MLFQTMRAYYFLIFLCGLLAAPSARSDHERSGSGRSEVTPLQEAEIERFEAILNGGAIALMGAIVCPTVIGGRALLNLRRIGRGGEGRNATEAYTSLRNQFGICALIAAGAAAGTTHALTPATLTPQHLAFSELLKILEVAAGSGDAEDVLDVVRTLSAEQSIRVLAASFRVTELNNVLLMSYLILIMHNHPSAAQLQSAMPDFAAQYEKAKLNIESQLERLQRQGLPRQRINL